MLSSNNEPAANLGSSPSGNLPVVCGSCGHVLPDQLHQLPAFGQLPEAKRLLRAGMNHFSFG